MNVTSPALLSKNNFFQSPLTNNNISSDALLLLSNSAFPIMGGDESCEVSSSSPLNGYGTSHSPPALMNINTDLGSTSFQCHPDEVDLSFWGLDINTSPTALYGMPTSSTSSGLSFPSEEGSSPIGRDDLSPASSINSSCFGTEPVEKKKKTSNSRQMDELCLVCGDRASGYHYNALTCEGCKGFFRRSITKKAVYSCKYGQNCEMDMYMRRKCQECRFKKCIAVGMRQECVVPENTCQQKREQKKAREKDKILNTEPLTPNPSELTMSGLQMIPGLSPPINLPGSLKSCGKIELTKEHQELINRLIINQDEYESPLEKNVQKSLPPASSSVTDASFHQITEMTKLTVELIVQFALNAPGFISIPIIDQVTLLKACSSELIMLRASRRYHPDTDSIVFANNTPCTREFYVSAGMERSTTDSLFNFCRRMAEMKVDNAEYALLSGITLFSERPKLTEAKGVEVIQFLYVETLYAYVTNKWSPKSGTMIAKLLDVLTQLRTLGVMNSEQVFKIDGSGLPLPDLIKELWVDRERR